jgi:hypothetical protein
LLSFFTNLEGYDFTNLLKEVIMIENYATFIWGEVEEGAGVTHCLRQRPWRISEREQSATFFWNFDVALFYG